MSVHNRLKTRGKLFQYGVCTDNNCCICGQGIKCHDHLFFDCIYSQQLLRNVLEWLGIKFRRRNTLQWITWVYRAYKGTKTRKMVICTVLAATTYQIWRVRNDAYWHSYVNNIQKSTNLIKYCVKHRKKFCIP